MSGQQDQSVYRLFALQTLDAQLNTAYRVRDMQNFDYVLYDPAFVRTRIERIGNFRVEIDSFNRRAILSRGAQMVFDVNTYMSMINELDHHDIKLHEGKVYLCAKPHKVSVIDK